jgi:hypothetical protein
VGNLRPTDSDDMATSVGSKCPPSDTVEAAPLDLSAFLHPARKQTDAFARAAA